MVGWWPGDGNANDITPLDHDGTFASNTFTMGKVMQAFSLDGTDDYVDVPDKPDLNPGTITVDAWVYANSFGQFSAIIKKSNADQTKGYALEMQPDKEVAFWVYVKNGLISGWQHASSVMTLTSGNWYHVAGTYDGIAIKIYVNGALKATMPAPGAIVASTNHLNFGRDPSNPSASQRYWHGLIDEVELFNRALTDGEIGAIYKADTAGKCKCQEKPVDADGDIKDDDGGTSKVKLQAKRDCDDNGQTDFTDNETGEEMVGLNKAIAISGPMAMVSGVGKLLNGSSVYYTAVLVANQALAGANLFSMTWTDGAGSFFHRSGVMMNGIMTVPAQ
jgi:hypothetical protein